MKLGFKFILFAVLFLCGCSFIPNKASAEVIATHKSCRFYPLMTFTVEREGSDIFVRFGDITSQYMLRREANSIKGRILEDKILKRYIIEVLAHYHANIAIVDNIKYEYNPANKTHNVIE